MADSVDPSGSRRAARSGGVEVLRRAMFELERRWPRRGSSPPGASSIRRLAFSGEKIFVYAPLIAKTDPELFGAMLDHDLSAHDVLLILSEAPSRALASSA